MLNFQRAAISEEECPNCRVNTLFTLNQFMKTCPDILVVQVNKQEESEKVTISDVLFLDDVWVAEGITKRMTTW